MIRLLAILLVIALLFWAIRRLLGGPGTAASEQHAPLVIEPDDPLMIEAIGRARETMGEFRRLLAEKNRGARVKVPFRTDAGAEEHVWADVIALVDSAVEVELTTQPVSQRAPVPTVQRYALADVLDWQVELPDGRYAGGFTMRAMFRKGREQWGRLPARLEAEERRYQ